MEKCGTKLLLKRKKAALARMFLSIVDYVHLSQCRVICTIWKYNAVYHLLSKHSQDASGFASEKIVSPKIPGQMAIVIFISSTEEGILKIPSDATKQYRLDNCLLNSDDIEEAREEVKRDRAPTVSLVEPSGKRRQK
jgi:hypothetical protein